MRWFTLTIAATSMLFVQPARADDDDAPAHPPVNSNAPNILVILTDDIGYGAGSTFGGPIETPNFDRLAQRGVTFTNFHTTGICSATRAALLTGRNHHNVGMGRVTEGPAASPGYSTIIGRNTATIAQLLKDRGYSTAMFGKAHFVPRWEQSAAGPFDRWPSGLGFDYFYGFLNGDTNQYAPQLFLGNTPVEPPYDDAGYILDKDLADKAIRWIAQQRASHTGRPFFAYYAPGTAHAPLQAPAEWIARYKGRFDRGWDEMREEILVRQKAMGIVPHATILSARPPELLAWSSIPAERQRVYARMMEVHAAAISYMDAQVGRVLDELDRSGQRDNTLVLFVQGDNGSSAEGHEQGVWNELTFINGVPEDFELVKQRLDSFGGPHAYNHYPAGWAYAMSTPFPYFKRVSSHLGATSNAMVLSWPVGAGKAGGKRPQFGHVIDIAPTILEAAGIGMPGRVAGVVQKPMDGTSLLYALADPHAAERHDTQYFEMEGNRAIYSQGWIASTTPTVMPWKLYGNPPFDADEQAWELYDLRQDFGQAVNVAARYPEKLKEMRALFDQEARKFQVYPQAPAIAFPPAAALSRSPFVYTTPVARIPLDNAPNLLNASFEIKARIDIPAAGANGVLVTAGGRFGGYGLRVDRSVPVFTYNFLGLSITDLRAPAALGAGAHDVTVRFDYAGGGRGRGGDATLIVDGQTVAVRHIDATIPVWISLSETFDIGSDTGTPVSEDYAVPAAFTGEIERIEVTPLRAAAGPAPTTPVPPPR